MENLKYYNNNEAICPHCDHVHSDSWEIDEDDISFTCENCDEDFFVSVETTKTYTTSKEEIY